MITINDIINRISTHFATLSEEELKSFNRYFTLEHYFMESSSGWYHLDREIKFTFTLKISGVSALSYELKYDGRQLSEQIASPINSDVILKAFGYALKDYFDNNRNNVLEKIRDLYNKYFRYIKENYKKSFTEELNKITKQAEEIDVINDLSPVHLYPILSKHDDSFLLSFKIARIGKNKLYSVTSFDSFITRFKYGTTFKFGKELEFKHVLNALDKPSARFVEKMLNRSVRSGKFINVDNQLAEDLFYSYKGEDIFFSDNPDYSDGERYNVRLEPCNIGIKIDKNYILSVVFDGNNYAFIGGKYIIDFENKIVDYVGNDSIYSALVSSIINSPYPCIEDNVDDFKYNYLIRYPDKFIIAHEIKEEFAFTALTIKAYFDFDDKVIYLSEEIYLDDNKVRVEDLSYRLAAQYRKYRSIISNLGFVDNILSDQGKILEFLSSSLETLKQYCEVYLSDNILNKTILRFNPPNLRVQYNSSILEVFMDESRYDDDELLAIIDGLRKKKKFILYKDQIINLDNEDAQRFIDNVEDFHLLEKGKNNKDNKLPIYYAFKALDNSSGISLNEQIFAIFDEIKHYKKSPFKGGKINGELRPYQLEGVKWLHVLYHNYLNGILADDMGLGKTIEIISFLKGEKIKGNVLIVAPKSLVFNWKNEFSKFDPEAKIISIYGGAKERETIINDIKNTKETVYLTSYDSFRRDENLYENISFDTVILDEAQYIKNARAKKTIALTHIESEHRFVLTGTPIENSILDLWSIFNFLMPNYLPDEEEFKKNYEKDPQYASKIRNYVSPFILRRNKKDVLKDLPDKYELIVSSEMNEAQRKVYDAYILLAKKKIEEGEGRVFELLPIMTRLRQICIHPSLFLDNYNGGSGKIDSLNEIIDEKIEEGHTLLIFSQFVTALNLVKEMLTNKGIEHFIITGDTKAEDRVRIAEEFNTTKRIKVGLVSLKAGGTGLNLVGADVVIHLDPWWNIAAQDQATDRAHRIGQERNVEVIKLIAENSIEQRVVELQNIKKELVDKIIANDDTLITSLSLDDIQFILK